MRFDGQRRIARCVELCLERNDDVGCIRGAQNCASLQFRTDPMPDSAPRFFRNRNGRVVIAQPPNVPLIGWLVLRVAAWLLPPGVAERLCDAFADGFMFTWAYLEIAHGDSPFRRALGGVVIAWFAVKVWPGLPG